MSSKRKALATLLGVAGLVLLADPVLAQGYDSTTEELIQSLNTQLLYMAIPITVLVEGILIYTVWKFRKNDDPKPTKENRRLEISWTIATALVLLVVGYASYGVMANEYVTGTENQLETTNNSDAVNVEVVGVRYLWEYNYEDENVSATGTLVLPKNTEIYLNVTSDDWIHAFHVPDLGLKQDAMPGQHNTIKTKLTDEGTYQLYCAEYCGVGHSQMLGEVEVVSQQEYQDWLSNQTDGGSA